MTLYFPFHICHNQQKISEWHHLSGEYKDPYSFLYYINMKLYEDILTQTNSL